MKIKILNYFKNLIYNVLELFSSAINLVMALLGIHASLSWGVDFLVSVESNRINKEVSIRNRNREKKHKEAAFAAEKAKELFELSEEE